LRYHRNPTTIDQQIELLLARGMVGDEELMRRWLKTVGYYRLSAYWLPWELPSSHGKTRSKKFPPNTKFDNIIDIYVFDRKLRLIVMEAIDRFEIAVRAQWTNQFAIAHGSHAHMVCENFSDGYDHARMYAKIADTVSKSSEVFITHYRDKYKDPFMPPLWQVTELMTLGEISMWVKATKDNVLKDLVARELGLPNKETLEGTLQLLSYIRNICAHHGRLWNRRTVKRAPNIKKFRDDLVVDKKGSQLQPENSIYNVLVILSRTLIHQSPDTTFPYRVATLIATRPHWQVEDMGFPNDWLTRPVWRSMSNESQSRGNRFSVWLKQRLGLN
jgi:abortive infection bacteriophage resistance protein